MTSTTSFYCGATGRPVMLGCPIGPPGAEGRVYTLRGQQGQVAKLYHRNRLGRGADLATKLAAMVAAPPKGAQGPGDHWALAWPLALLHDAGGAFVGFTMPAVQNSRAAQWHMIANPSDRDNPPPSRLWTPGFGWRYRLHAAANLADAVGSLLDAGYVPGDLSGDNVFVHRSALITIIDVDSMQVRTPGGGLYHCAVWRDEYLAPELADRRHALASTLRHPSSALFALGVLIYEMLMAGRHPFRGIWRGSGEPPSQLSLAARGILVDGPDPRLISGSGAMDPQVLSPELQILFDRAFVHGASEPTQRPSAAEWTRCLHRAAAAVRSCQHRSHSYPDHLDICPWCDPATGTKGSRPPVPTERAPTSSTPANAPPMTPNPPTSPPAPAWVATPHMPITSPRRGSPWPGLAVIAFILLIILLAVVHLL